MNTTPEPMNASNLSTPLNGTHPPPKLSPDHLAMLTNGSGIAPEVIAERGYRTSTGYSELKSLGIDVQRDTDTHGLLLPLHTVEGKPGIHYMAKADTSAPFTVYRPDAPEIDKEGRVRKYLSPKGAATRLDCPPRCQPYLADPTIPVWFTEGQKKADALASHDACAIALLGVWNFRGTNARGGKTLLPDWQYVALNGREVRVVFDSDVMEKPEVQQALDALTGMLTSKGARVYVAYLPSIDGTKVGVDDYLLTHTLQDLERLLVAPGQREEKRPATDTRPEIRITPNITAMVDAGEAALRHMDGAPLVFQRARCLVHIATGVRHPWLTRPADAPVIALLEDKRIDELATQAACWMRLEKRTRQWHETEPPGRFAQTLRARPFWKLPVLEGIVCAPTLRPDGSILELQGYDAQSGLYLDLNGATFAPVPLEPSWQDAKEALAQLGEVIDDFPFETQAHRSAALAAILTVVARHAIDGNCPAFGVSATAPGSGKGKLVDAVAILATGRGAPKMGQTLNEDEELKRLLALALEGERLCCVDNAVHPFGNQYLDMALTAREIQGRILGVTQTRTAPWTAVLFVTGNHLTYKGDMVRRVLPIVLDAKVERPEERTGFKHPELESWVLEQRPRLVVAALTILRAYVVAGKPEQAITQYGSFEAWSDLVRSALVWCRIEDPCAGRAMLAAEADQAYEDLATLLEAWDRCYPGAAGQNKKRIRPIKTLNEIKQDIALYADYSTPPAPNKWNELAAALQAYDRKADGHTLNMHRIGKGLQTIERRTLGGKRLKNQQQGNMRAWTIEDV